MLYVIGIGPGQPEYLLPAAAKAARRCQALAGGPRALALFGDVSCTKFKVTGDLKLLEEFLVKHIAEGKNVGVLVSGDAGFYSLLPFLRKTLPDIKIEVIPGISSLQMAFARAGLAWQEAVLTSVHGRPLEALETNPRQLMGLLTGKENSPQHVARYLLKNGPNRRAFLGNNLAYPDEIWLDTDLTNLISDGAMYANAVLIIMPVEENDVDL